MKVKAKLVKAAPKGDLSVGLPAEIVKDLGEIYNKCHQLKAEMDRMEEVPNWLKPLYDACMKTADQAAKAKQTMYQAERQFAKDWKRLS